MTRFLFVVKGLTIDASASTVVNSGTSYYTGQYNIIEFDYSL